MLHCHTMDKFLILFVLIFACEVFTMDLMNSNSTNKKFFELILDRFELLTESPEIADWHIRVRKVNKTRALVGFISIYEPFGNNFLTEYKVLKKQGGEYRYLPYSVPRSPICDFFEKDPYFYQYFANHSDFPNDIAANCPLSPGNYSIYGISYELDSTAQMILQSGEYAGEIFFYKNDVNVFTYRLYAFINKV
ncbi:hypothetical protein ACKWTF_009418 [Chironomus riparius]